MGLGKKHEVSIKLEDYLHCIIGDKKIGKSTLVADIAEELYGSIDSLLMLSIGSEKAYEAINGAVYEEPQSWKELMDIVKEFVKGGHDFKMLSFDTLDELISMAEGEVIRLHTVKNKEVPKSFNACFGGYGEPRKQLTKLIDELLDTIKDTGYGYYFIGHNKARTIKSKTDSEDYVVITSNLSADYFNTIAYKCPIICNIVSDVNTDSFTTSDFNGDKTKQRLNNKMRYMHFRDDSYIEAGSRFSELPVKIEYGAKEYIEAVTEGIKASISKRKSAPKAEKAEEVEKEVVVEPPKATKKEVEPEVVEAQTEPEVEEEIQMTNKQLVEAIREEFGRLQGNGMKNAEILKVMAEGGTDKPSDKTKKPVLKSTLEALKKVK